MSPMAKTFLKRLTAMTHNERQAHVKLFNEIPLGSIFAALERDPLYRFRCLTDQEMGVVIGYLNGRYAGKENAHGMGISPGSYKVYMNRVLSKLGIRGHAELIVMVERLRASKCCQVSIEDFAFAWGDEPCTKP